MTLESTDDLNLIGNILFSDDCFTGSSEDGLDRDQVDLSDLKNTSWILIKSQSDIAGCFGLDRKSLSEIDAHIAIMKRFRGCLSRHAVNALIRVFASNMEPRINKMSVQIPEDNKACIRLAESAGFKREGINRKSVMKNGVFIDQIRLGITREEAGLCLN